MRTYSSDQEAYEDQIQELVQLDESRRDVLDKTIQRQTGVKGYFDQSTRDRAFKKGDIVLLWDKKNEKP